MVDFWAAVLPLHLFLHALFFCCLTTAAGELVQGDPLPVSSGSACIRHTQAEIYSGVLGGADGSAPAEYLEFPVDYYTAEWYMNLGVYGGKDLFSLYETAYRWLK